MNNIPSGNVKNITSLSNPIIKNFKALFLKKNREKQNLFVAEGLKIIIEALENNWEITNLLFTPNKNLSPLLDEVILKIKNQGALIISTTPQILSSISRRDNPQTVIGIIKRKIQNLTELNTNNNFNLLALDRIKDPGNLGTIIRTADAVGLKNICLLGDCTDPFAIETVRASMGSIFAVNIFKSELDNFITWQKNFNGQTIGTYLKGALDFRKVNYYDKNNLLIMGNEQQGICDKLLNICDKLIKIPQQGRADSLNLSVATALALYEIYRKQLTLD
ncbi:TrmH family RNA methyltransferase [Bartonella sp. DGB1]|uniref:TrmH family RNA methyltransferase n=1 Tax=Bartonella sp. DGB1 TaxID=3239807 RepID=UPI00352613AC